MGFIFKEMKKFAAASNMALFIAMGALNASSVDAAIGETTLSHPDAQNFKATAGSRNPARVALPMGLSVAMPTSMLESDPAISQESGSSVDAAQDRIDLPDSKIESVMPLAGPVNLTPEANSRIPQAQVFAKDPVHPDVHPGAASHIYTPQTKRLSERIQHEIDQHSDEPLSAIDPEELNRVVATLLDTVYADEAKEAGASPLRKLPPLLNEAQIVEAVRHGDHEAFKKIYAHYFKPVFLRVLYMLPKESNAKEEVAKEMTHEAFVKFLTHIETFRGESTVGTWLYRTATNEALMHLRKLKSQGPVISLDEPMTNKKGEVVPREVADDRVSPRREAQRMGLRSALQRITPKHRAVLELYYFYGYDIPEIAARFDEKPDSVKSRFFRARQELLGILYERRDAKKRSLLDWRLAKFLDDNTLADTVRFRGAGIQHGRLKRAMSLLDFDLLRVFLKYEAYSKPYKPVYMVEIAKDLGLEVGQVEEMIGQAEARIAVRD